MGGIVLPEPIIGYRAWKLQADPPRLLPPHRSYNISEDDNPWKPRGIATAVCGTGALFGSFLVEPPEPAHPAAEEGCMCGLYAYYTLELAKEREDGWTVFGAVSCFGRLARHEWGVRAGKARIVGLLYREASNPHAPSREELAEIASIYEVPLFDDPEELKEEAQRWGEQLEPETSPSRSAGASSNHAFGPHERNSHGLWAQPPPPVYNSSYRSAEQQAALFLARKSLHGIRVLAEVEVYDNVEVQQVIDNFQKDTYKLKLPALDDRWIITGGKWEVEAIEYRAGSAPSAAFMPGRRTLTLELDCSFPDPGEAKLALIEIEKKVGRVIHREANRLL